MLRREIVLTIPGKPTPKGSMKCVGQRGKTKHQLVEDHRPGQKVWRSKLVGTVRAHVDVRAEQWAAVAVEVTFTIERPTNQYGTGRNATHLAVRAPEYPTKQNTNDVDKMLRLILDALTDAELLADDAQVVEVIARKAYPLLTHDDVAGPKPPPWIEGHRPVPDSLGYPGARIRVRPYPDPEELL